MKKCTLSEGKVNTLVNTFLLLVNTMKTFTVKYYLFIKKKETIKKVHNNIRPSLHGQSVHSVHSLPLKCSLKCSLNVHLLFTFGGFYVKC
jgi:hypothetical protein